MVVFVCDLGLKACKMHLMENNLMPERTTGNEDMPQLQGHYGAAKSQTITAGKESRA